MGTWAVDAFGNDSAADWAFGLEGTKDLALVEEALDKVVDIGDGYLEAPDAMDALAAAEVIARLQGNWGERSAYSEPADAWVEKTKLSPAAPLARKAHEAIDRILGEPSELRELWQESDDCAAWEASVLELKSRVHA
jgi:hypothetical protein